MKNGKMKIRLLVAVLSLACLPSLHAADGDATPGVKLAEDKPLKRNQVGVNYWLGLNIAVDFKNLGGFPRLTDPGPPTGGGINRYYDDGENLLDSSGNAGGLTWNWSYDHAQQTVGEDVLVLNSSASYDQTYKNDVEESATHGVEITYRRDLGRLYWGRWGLEAASAYTGFTVENDSTLSTSYTRISDAYVLNGVIPPQIPYEGTFEGPGPVISDSPQRVVSTVSGGAIVSGRRSLETDLFDFRLGPYWEVPLTKRVAVSLSGGLAFAVWNSEFRFRETVTIDGVGSVSSAGSDSQTDVIFGGYVAANVSYALTERLDLAAGAQWQYLGDQTHEGDSKEAVLDLGAPIFFSVGLGYSF